MAAPSGSPLGFPQAWRCSPRGWYRQKQAVLEAPGVFLSLAPSPPRRWAEWPGFADDAGSSRILYVQFHHISNRKQDAKWRRNSLFLPKRATTTLRRLVWGGPDRPSAAADGGTLLLLLLLFPDDLYLAAEPPPMRAIASSRARVRASRAATADMGAHPPVDAAAVPAGPPNILLMLPLQGPVSTARRPLARVRAPTCRHGQRLLTPAGGGRRRRRRDTPCVPFPSWACRRLPKPARGRAQRGGRASTSFGRSCSRRTRWRGRRRPRSGRRR